MKNYSKSISNASYHPDGLASQANHAKVVYRYVQARKHQDRRDRCRKDVESAKDKYEEALAVLHKYNNIYVDDMTEVFERTQIFEEKRLRFIKDLFVGVHGALDISKRPE